jgi:peptide/nickel transport system substrate-binding protein
LFRVLEPWVNGSKTETTRRNTTMKANRITRAVGIVAASALTVAGLSAVAIAPAGANTRSTVIIHTSGEITSLNPSVIQTTYNANVAYFTGFGFLYTDKGGTRVRNTQFGNFKLTKNTPTDFRITYNVRPGQQWSDGTPISAVDLLLSHVVASSEYSKSAGLGDPSDKTVEPAFDSGSYGGAYSDNVVGNPVLSNNNMTLTVRFKKPLPDWELLAPGPSPVHAMSLIADGKKGLQSASVNIAAKAKFLSAFTSKNTAHLKKIGKVYSKDYNITTVDSSTNKLLLLSNGGFIVQKADPTTMTLVRNAKYSSGPAMAKTNPIKTIVFKYIQSPTAAAAALRNGDIDIFWDPNATAATKTILNGIRSATTLAVPSAGFSHFELRTGPTYGKTNDPYNGPFAGNSQKAKDLRTAMLFALPREQMVETVIKPVNPLAVPMDSQFTFPGTKDYKKHQAATGVLKYSEGTQADRTAKALALVKKYFPTASADNPVVKVKLGFASVSALRVTLSKLIRAEALKAGFDVDITGDADWLGNTEPERNSEWDAFMYGFSLGAPSQDAGTYYYKTDGEFNGFGWSDPALDKILASLESDVLTPAQVLEKRIAADKIIIENAWGLLLYQGNQLVSHSKAIKGIDPSQFSPGFLWNYWKWSY